MDYFTPPHPMSSQGQALTFPLMREETLVLTLTLSKWERGYYHALISEVYLPCRAALVSIARR